MWTPFAVRSVFLVESFRLFELLTQFIHKMTLLVAMLAVPACVLESVFFLNVEVFGVSDSLGESILFVGNVELIFKNWFRLSMLRPSSLSIHA